ncbi:MAG: hypothetical protein ACI89W_000697 [Gammaproteobacteria bacterium]|jgi:hypothetical protein
MKTIMIFLSITMLLAGCASKPDYRAATNGSVGHSEQKISDDRYRVQFKIYSNSVADATDYALLRSAQLTQREGLDWFLVTSKETFIESTKMQPASSVGVTQSRETLRQCGLLTCDTYQRPSTRMNASISVGSQNERKEVHTVLDIRMGKGMKPNDDSYNAKDVIDNLGGKAYR